MFSAGSAWTKFGLLLWLWALTTETSTSVSQPLILQKSKIILKKALTL